MEGPAHDLESELWKRDKELEYGLCSVCDKDFGSLASHIGGEKHWKCVGNQCNWEWPTDTSAYDQIWVVEGIEYFFNHLTGEHGEVGLATSHADTSHGQVGLAPSRRWGKSRPAPPPPAPSGVWSDLIASEEGLATSSEVGLATSGQSSSAAAAPSNSDWEGLTCTSCQMTLPYDKFHKKQQKYSLTDRRCIDCTEAAWQEERMLQCIICKETLDRDKFNRHVDWDAPMCRECWEKEEDAEYASWCGSVGASWGRGR